MAGHVVAEIDLRVFGGSALTADIAVPKGRSQGEIGAGIPITYVPARNTIFLSFALAWAEMLGASDIFIGVNALDYSGYPDCRPEYIEAFERMANLATKAGVEGTQRLTIHTPLIELTKAGSSAAGSRSASTTRPRTSCYDPDARGPRLRRVRRLPAAAAGLRGGRASPIPRAYQPDAAVAAMTYTVKEIFYTLQGEGANAGRPAVFCRFAGCNLWTGREEDRATAVCTFCDTDFVGTDGPGGGKFRTRRRARRRGRGAVAARQRARPAARGLHRRRAAAAARRGARRRAARRGLRGRHRDQRHARAARRASTGSA